MRKRIRIWVLVVSLITLMGLTINFLIPSRNEISDEQSVLGNKHIDYNGVPYITSIPPQYIYLGELFKYTVNVSDIDTDADDISIFLTEKPIWMYIDGNVIRGLPSEIGTYKYVITVSDGEKSSSSVNYLLVEEYE